MCGVYFVPIQIGIYADNLNIPITQSGVVGSVEIAAMSMTAIVISPKLKVWSISKTAIM